MDTRATARWAVTLLPALLVAGCWCHGYYGDSYVGVRHIREQPDGGLTQDAYYVQYGQGRVLLGWGRSHMRKGNGLAEQARRESGIGWSGVYELSRAGSVRGLLRADDPTLARRLGFMFRTSLFDGSVRGGYVQAAAPFWSLALLSVLPLLRVIWRSRRARSPAFPVVVRLGPN